LTLAPVPSVPSVVFLLDFEENARTTFAIVG